MTDLHFRQFDGITVGMASQSATALRALKKSAYYGYVVPNGWGRPVKRLCVPAERVAAVMGEAAWLVCEGHYMETVRWGDDGADHYIIYGEEAR